MSWLSSNGNNILGCILMYVFRLLFLDQIQTFQDTCPALCVDRCAAHSRKNVCKRACETCCARCKCVPLGTSGNYGTCGKCYFEQKTHGGARKCP
ncbi:hypothetical protein MKW92_005167 [Papaver armeniacum]|nr:hypothetical protein MKW92_005167 [Papaver armeniacum]